MAKSDNDVGSDVEQLGARIAELGQRLVDAGGDVAAVTRLSAQLQAATAELDRRQRGASRAARSVAPSQRDLVLDALAELHAPTETKVLSRYLAARYDLDLPPGRFSSLRRDDRKRRGDDAMVRPVLTTALEAGRLTPVTNLLAVSTWPLETRLVAPRSKRVFSLEVGSRMLKQIRWLRDSDDAAAARLERVVAGLLASVPGATGKPWEPLDLARAQEAVDAELAVLASDDRAARDDAAERARAQLGPLEQVFGAEAPHVITSTGDGG